MEKSSKISMCFRCSTPDAWPFKSRTWKQRVAIGVTYVYAISGGGEASTIGSEVDSATSIRIETSNIGAGGDKTCEVTNEETKTNGATMTHGIYWGYGCGVY